MILGTSLLKIDNPLWQEITGQYLRIILFKPTDMYSKLRQSCNLYIFSYFQNISERLLFFPVSTKTKAPEKLVDKSNINQFIHPTPVI